jgi:hypothetical protein
MSAQGGTLQRRGTIEVPIWPVAVLVVAAVAAAIGMSVLKDAGQTTFVTSVTDVERLANSSAAIREQGAVAPTISLTNSGAAISHRGFAIPEYAGVSHVAPSLHSAGYAGFENPGAYVTEAPALVPGLENPGAYPGEIVAPAEGPIIVNGEACMQCR